MQSHRAGNPGIAASGQRDVEYALVIVSQCRQLGDEVVSPQIFSAMILVTLGSCIIAPILLRRRLHLEAA